MIYMIYDRLNLMFWLIYIKLKCIIGIPACCAGVSECSSIVEKVLY